jgi:APA family basic amino acid/polyamine antiporter
MDGGDGGRLRRELGVFGASMMGLGSIVGTGVFVSIGVAAGIAGPAVVVAVALGAVVATLNGLSSAQLAAAHPVSGGTYEYGYRYLDHRFGFLAGWVFLLAKSASAATAALGFGAYLAVLFDWGGGDATAMGIGLGIAAATTLVVLAGIRRSNATNIVIVTVTLAALAAFVAAGFAHFDSGGFSPFLGDGGGPGLLEATALMFVAYTGYGRIATLGEEVRDPRRIIPRAIITTLAVSMILYVSVAAAGVGAAGAGGLAAATGSTAAPLEVVARGMSPAGIDTVVAIGAVTAMAGVLLNLVLGLSRVVLAMARRGDAPGFLSRIGGSAATPRPAVVAVGLTIGALVAVGDVETTWSFSAFTVLVYYAVTNLAATRLPERDRRFPRWMSWAGLAACLFLAFWVDRVVWLVGAGLAAAGLVAHEVAHRRRRDRQPRREVG